MVRPIAKSGYLLRSDGGAVRPIVAGTTAKQLAKRRTRQLVGRPRRRTGAGTRTWEPLQAGKYGYEKALAAQL